MENRKILSLSQVQKRDGRLVEYDQGKIRSALSSAFDSTETPYNEEILNSLTDSVEHRLMESKLELPQVEEIQDFCEEILQSFGYYKTSKAYILYRDQRNKMRTMNSHLMKLMETITFQDAENEDLKRENANVDGNTAMGTMLKYGSESAKAFTELFVLETKYASAHKEGLIHIHDMDFYNFTTTCSQIDLLKLFSNGFSTGHGHLREPQDILSYSALACIAIQSNQNDQHGGQSIPNFDYAMAEGVRKTYKKLFHKNLMKALTLLNVSVENEELLRFYKTLNNRGIRHSMSDFSHFDEELHAFLSAKNMKSSDITKSITFSRNESMKETDRSTYQAMEALIHNLNTMNSRAGAQVPFSSINYGTDTTAEGRLVMKNLLLSLERGLGNGETPIFPIHIFRIKDGVNLKKEDVNYDLFEQAVKVSSKRLFPNFSFQDAPFNLKYYKEGQPETEISYMGCRTRVISNVVDENLQTSYGRGNLSFTSINLPRIAILSEGDVSVFFNKLNMTMELVIDQLLHRYQIQIAKKVKNFPFLMGQGIWTGSEKLVSQDTLEGVLKHGTLSVGFIGLAEALVALTGKHHGECKDSQEIGLKIISAMRNKLDQESEKRKLNFSLIASPAEGLSGRFVSLDQKIFGKITGVTDKVYYTNSFHVPVHYALSAFDKINIEAPYHELPNAGHITYVELDGDASKNPKAFMKIIQHMQKSGIGYGSINHPVDYDSACGYQGIIDDICPKCGRKEESHPFTRIRRITGYLVGSLDRFNDAKLTEVKDRVIHARAGLNDD